MKKPIRIVAEIPVGEYYGRDVILEIGEDIADVKQTIEEALMSLDFGLCDGCGRWFLEENLEVDDRCDFYCGKCLDNHAHCEEEQ